MSCRDLGFYSGDIRNLWQPFPVIVLLAAFQYRFQEGAGLMVIRGNLLLP